MPSKKKISTFGTRQKWNHTHNSNLTDETISKWAALRLSTICLNEHDDRHRQQQNLWLYVDSYINYHRQHVWIWVHTTLRVCLGLFGFLGNFGYVFVQMIAIRNEKHKISYLYLKFWAMRLKCHRISWTNKSVVCRWWALYDDYDDDKHLDSWMRVFGQTNYNPYVDLIRGQVLYVRCIDALNDIPYILWIWIDKVLHLVIWNNFDSWDIALFSISYNSTVHHLYFVS